MNNISNVSGSMTTKTSRPEPTSNDDRTELKTRQAVERLIGQQKFNEAMELLARQSYPEAKNLTGICLMLSGRPELAVQLYRSLLLDGTGNLRPTVPDDHIVNFATALLMTGRPAGCLEILWSVKDKTRPDVIRLQEAIQQWSRSLGWWARFNWRFGKIEPTPCVVPINFQPGERFAE